MGERIREGKLCATKKTFVCSKKSGNMKGNDETTKLFVKDSKDHARGH